MIRFPNHDPVPSPSKLICIKEPCVLDALDILDALEAHSWTLADRWRKHRQTRYASMMWMFNILLTSKWKDWAEGQLEKIPSKKMFFRRENRISLRDESRRLFLSFIEDEYWEIDILRLKKASSEALYPSLSTSDRLQKTLFNMSRLRLACGGTASFCWTHLSMILRCSCGSDGKKSSMDSW